MQHSFRPRKESGGRRRRPSGGNKGLPQNIETDLESLPEKDYNHYDQLTPAALLKEAKSAKLDAKTLLRHEVIERLLIQSNEQSDVAYAKGILELLPDGYGFLRRDDIHDDAARVDRATARNVQPYALNRNPTLADNPTRGNSY
jgi:transcription termination factor Rho